MSFAKRIINFERLLLCRPRFRKRFGGGHFAEDAKYAVCLRKSEVGARVSRINFNRLLEIGNTCSSVRRCSFGQVVTSLHVKLISLDIFRRMLFFIPSPPYLPFPPAPFFFLIFLPPN